MSLRDKGADNLLRATTRALTEIVVAHWHKNVSIRYICIRIRHSEMQQASRRLPVRSSPTRQFACGNGLLLHRQSSSKALVPNALKYCSAKRFRPLAAVASPLPARRKMPLHCSGPVGRSRRKTTCVLRATVNIEAIAMPIAMNRGTGSSVRGLFGTVEVGRVVSLPNPNPSARDRWGMDEGVSGAGVSS